MMTEDIPENDDKRGGTFIQFQKSIGIAIQLNFLQFDLYYGCDQQDRAPLEQLETSQPHIIQQEISDWAASQAPILTRRC